MLACKVSIERIFIFVNFPESEDVRILGTSTDVVLKHAVFFARCITQFAQELLDDIGVFRIEREVNGVDQHVIIPCEGSHGSGSIRVSSKDEVTIFRRCVARKAGGLHNGIGFSVGELSKTPAAGRGVFF